MGISAIAMVTLLGSCSVFNGILPRKEKVKVETQEQEAVLPHDREQISSKKEVKVYTPQELSKGMVKGDWAIEEVNGREAIGEEKPFMKFDNETKMVYGNNGCNSFSGSYAYNPKDSTISFSNMATTMRLCGKEGITDIQINLAMDAARYYSWEVKDSNYYVYLLNGDRQKVMTLMHRNFDFLNGVWRVTRINQKPINEPDMKLVIDVAEGKLHGNTGCNILNGVLNTDMNGDSSICFSSIATTRMACPDSSNETSLLVALEDAANVKPLSPNEVLLLDTDGNAVLTLVRTK